MRAFFSFLFSQWVCLSRIGAFEMKQLFPLLVGTGHVKSRQEVREADLQPVAGVFA